jgi:hypothetical protein
MGWDANRPVPWQRMVREWLIYVAIMLVLLVIMFRDQPLIGIIAGLLVSGPLYLGFGYVLAKFGYRRKSWKELRDATADDTADDARERSSKPAGPRPKPAPTSRTGGATTRPGGARKRR